MKNMRLDKYLSLAGIASRTETSKAVRGGEVLVNGMPAKKRICRWIPTPYK